MKAPQRNSRTRQYTVKYRIINGRRLNFLRLILLVAISVTTVTASIQLGDFTHNLW